MEYIPANQNPSQPNVQGQASTIPSSWEVTTLDKVCVGPPQNGAFIKDARFGSGTLYVNVYDIYQNAVLMPGHVQRVKWDDAAKERYLLKNGDLLFVRSSLKREGVGHCCLVTNLNEPAIFDCHLIRVSPDTSTVEPLYLTYFCLAATQRRDLIARSKTTTMTTMNQNMLMQTPIVLPPMPQQQAIARALAVVQNAREERERELVLEREHKAALMEHLFTHGTRGLESISTDVGELPASWKVVSLEQVVGITYGIQAAVAHLKDPSKGIPILTNVNMRNDGRLDFTTLRYFPLPERLRERGLLKKGDVLFNWRSGSQDHVGKTAVFAEDRDFTYSSFILRFRPSDKVNSLFLAYYLHAIKKRGYFSQNRQQSSVNSVFNASVAATIPVALPTLEEQDEIADALKAADRKILALEKERQLAEELFSAMSEELMTGRISAMPLMEEKQPQ